MTYSLKISEYPGYPWLFEERFSSEEELESAAIHCWSKRRIGLFESTLYVVRTHTIRNFCQDFFLPTFFNHALKTRDLAKKFFAIALCVLIDLGTLGFRCITLIPRVYFNQDKEAHPLHRYLAKKGANESLLNKEYVFVSLEAEELSEKKEIKRRGELEQVIHYVDLPETEIPLIRGWCFRQGHEVQDSPYPFLMLNT